MSLTQLDANQITKAVFNVSNRALTNIPAFVDTTALFTASSGATTFTSSPVDILPYKVTGIVVTWTGFNHTDSTVQFEGSVDGVSYETIGAASTLGAAAGHQSFSLIDEPYHYFHIVFTHGTNTTGTISASYIQRA